MKTWIPLRKWRCSSSAWYSLSGFKCPGCLRKNTCLSIPCPPPQTNYSLKSALNCQHQKFGKAFPSRGGIVLRFRAKSPNCQVQCGCSSDNGKKRKRGGIWLRRGNLRSLLSANLEICLDQLEETKRQTHWEEGKKKKEESCAEVKGKKVQKAEKGSREEGTQSNMGRSNGCCKRQLEKRRKREEWSGRNIDLMYLLVALNDTSRRDLRVLMNTIEIEGSYSSQIGNEAFAHMTWLFPTTSEVRRKVCWVWMSIYLSRQHYISFLRFFSLCSKKSAGTFTTQLIPWL